MRVMEGQEQACCSAFTHFTFASALFARFDRSTRFIPTPGTHLEQDHGKGDIGRDAWDAVDRKDERHGLSSLLIVRKAKSLDRG